jgi:hypothetical protein
MASIKISSSLKLQFEEVLDGVAKLDTPDLEKFLAEVAHLLVQRKAKTIPEREALLLLKINQRLLEPETLEKYSNLYQKLQEETITEKEHENLLKLIQKREEKAVERMSYLVELAQLRKVSLKDLMKQLGMDSLADAA